jgi:hypothetical protein
LLFQRLHDLWSDFARKYPFFFSVVHRKFKLENDFSFRLHTRTLFAFELPPETHIRMHIDMNKAKSFGYRWDTPSVQQIFKDPQFDIDRLTTGEGGIIEMDAARALVKVSAPCKLFRDSSFNLVTRSIFNALQGRLCRHLLRFHASGSNS